eukprot:scaffold23469_cov88-Cylindrotheca_fusiformis.AAC.1
MADAKGFGPPKTPNDARGRYVSKLLGGAKETTPNSKLGQRLENGNGYNVDISSYSIKFQRCQLVKSYDDELAADEETPTVLATKSVLATKRFIVFRLCPNNNCQSCNYNYGEYLVDLETYLRATIDYQKESQQEKCYACQNYCGDGDDANSAQRDGLEKYQNDIDCDTCYEECVKIENMEEMGFIDATAFIECQVLYDPDDDGKTTLYAGPMCSGSGYKIKIGVFTDQYCSVLDSTKDVEDYVMDEDGTQSKLSHALLKTVYSDESCVACTGGNDDDDDGGAYEMCGALYQESAKCETTHGFENGYANYNGYDTQLQQEEIVCDFIDSIKAGSNDKYGEIVVNHLANSGTMTTSGQKFALTLFVLLTAGWFDFPLL